MTNTIVNQGRQAAFGMPASARLQVTSPRALPMSQECSVPGALRVREIAGHVSDYRFATVDATAIKDAFWGATAWSPPS